MFSGDQKIQLREQLLNAAFGKVPHAANKGLQAFAVVLKIGWLEDPVASSEFLVKAFVSSMSSDTNSLIYGLKMMHCVLQEMTVMSNTSVDRPWTFHVECHRSFEKS